jgi:hypothetical protein
MAWLQGRVVRFRLSPEGKLALSGVFDKESVLALVEIVDDLGAWIAVGKPSVGGKHSLMLLKWDYFSTAVLEIEPVEEARRSPLGFGV